MAEWVVFCVINNGVLEVVIKVVGLVSCSWLIIIGMAIFIVVTANSLS